MKFKSWVEHTLCTVTAILMLPLVMLDSIELSAIPYLLGGIAIILLNLCLLKKWGRGLWLEKEED